MPDPELTAELQALHDLAAKHRREFVRLRTIHLARLTGTTPHFTRDRMTQAQLQALPPVKDGQGVELEPGLKVRCPDGVRAEVQRVDRRSKRCVVLRADGLQKMVVASRLTVMGRTAAQQLAHVG